ncbi:hypothetical protein M9H77_04820 [Catharanthus roseus]|uniref:Uncharacterized protein n=1 Tax=Catharanthus roseus TaxID=4058 RepID=A0ACC0CFI5_CATRO|nr:hypothetical protein M9H77_04820 [Catharanthus roseus]
MEEVPAHVHPDPLSLMSYLDSTSTDPCRRFGRNLFQCYSAAPRRLVEIIDRTAVHNGFGRCTTDWKGLGVSSDMGVVAYTYIAASADNGDYCRPSCSSWPAYAHSGYIQRPFMWLPYYDRPLVPSDLW